MSAKFEKAVDWAKRNKRCEQENTCQNDEYNAERARYDAAKIKISEECCNNNTDGAVDIRHIAFHNNSP